MNIYDVQIIQSELSNIDSNTRRMHVDAFYVVNEYLYVHIEINGEFHDWVHYRNYLFFSNIVSGIPRKGQKYKDIDKFIHIDITWGLHSEKEIKEEIELEYEIVEKDHKEYKYLKDIRYLEYNMDKVMESWYNIINNKGTKEDFKIIKNYGHLVMLNVEKDEVEKFKEIYKGDDFLVRVIDLADEKNSQYAFLNYISPEEDFRLCVNSEVAAQVEEKVKERTKQIKKQAKEEAKAQAKEQIKEQVKEQVKEHVKEQVKKMIENHISPDIISKCTNLSKNC